MSELRDYEQWHQAYDDPNSGLSWRLSVVQEYLRQALDRDSGPVRILSLCSGDARDVLEVLAERTDKDRAQVTLVELNQALAEAAQARATAAGLTSVQVRTTDAGNTDAYLDATPADIVLLVGIFGNISDTDLDATIAAAGQLCRPDDLNDRVRSGFNATGFVEIDYRTGDFDELPALGAMRYNGPELALTPGRQLFSFIR